MNNNKRDSYTSADALPIKLIKNDYVQKQTQRGNIPPIHAQIIPTNVCNMNCSFCSCSERDKTLSLKPKDLEAIMGDLEDLGCQAITWTGGGEPTLYPAINEALLDAQMKGIESGLVTNGLRLNNIRDDALNSLTWARISHGDHRDMSSTYQKQLEKHIKRGSGVDWAISYVLSEKMNPVSLYNTIKFANEMNMSHVRVVADLFNPGKVDMERARSYLEGSKGLDMSRIIFQPRQNPVHGGDCLIGYLKPLIGADRQVYACCGVQYALATPSKDLPKELSLGDARDLFHIYTSIKPLDGSKCVKCYYGAYNSTLGGMIGKQDHGKFV